MIRKLFISMAFMLSLGCPAVAASTNDELVALLIQDFGKYNDACRGGSGDQNETWAACGSRDYASDLLYEFGWCYGKTGQAAYEMDWHVCSASSIRNSTP
jgi:hypothetical protein